MLIFKKEYPWDHFVVTDVLSQDSLRTVENFAKDKDAPPRTRNTHLIDSRETVYSIFKGAMSEFCREIGHSTTGKYFLLECSICGPHHKYDRIHCDNENKDLTFVYYLSDHNLGTMLYKEHTKSSFVGYSDWNKNGGMAFIRKNHTFHDFEADSSVRKTFNLILAKNMFAGNPSNFEKMT